MKPGFTAAVLILFAALISCKRTAENSAEENIFNVSFEQCKTSVDLKLSDLTDDCSLIMLETTDESMLASFPRLVTNDPDIIIYDRNGVYKFSSEGSFVRKIINKGNGPDEISISFTCIFNEKTNQMIINDRMRNRELLIYDTETEKFLEPVKKCVPGWWGSFVLCNDSLILATSNPVIADTNSYALFLQNFKGDFLSGIAGDRKILNRMREIEQVQRLVICPGDIDIYTHYVFDDTLFRYNNNKLSPYLIVSYNTPRDFIRATLAEVGESRVGFPSIDNPGFMILYESILQGSTQIDRGTMFNYDRNYFFLNKSDGSFSRIKSYTDNITGKVQESNGDQIRFPEMLPGGKFYILYEASELKAIEPNNQLLRDMPAGIYDQMHEILENLDEMDNQVLLTGTFKKNIKLSQP